MGSDYQQTDILLLSWTGFEFWKLLKVIWNILVNVVSGQAGRCSLGSNINCKSVLRYAL